MWQGEIPRAHGALRTAFALTVTSLNHHDSVGLFPFSDELRIAMRPRNGRARTTRIADALSKLVPGGETDFQGSLGKLGRMGLRPGLLVVISDFFDPKGIQAITESLGKQRHRLLLVQLYRQSDADPTLQGDVLLRDCESGQEHDISITGDVISAYKRAYQDFEERLSEFAMSRQAGLCLLYTSDAADE